MNEFDIDTLEETNRGRVQGWFDLAGLEAEFPVTAAVAVQVLRAVDYSIDADRLVMLADRGYIPVQRDNGRLQFNATSLVAAAANCEARRWWKPFSAIHAHKFSMVEKLAHVQAERGEKAIADLGEYDVDFLLGLLHKVGGDQATTAAVAEAIRLKLREQDNIE